MSKPAKLFVVLAALCTSLFAQQQQSGPSVAIQALSKQRAALAKEWLQSKDPLHIAWGAAIARQDVLPELKPLLVEQLKDYPEAGSADGTYHPLVDADRHKALLGVLDSVILLGVPVDPETAYKFYGEFPAQSLILLVRSSGNTRSHALLDIFRQTATNNDWLAAGNVLVNARQPGFAAAVLQNFTRHLVVTVVDPHTGVTGGFGSGSSCCGAGGVMGDSAWPSVGLYALSSHPADGATYMLLANGDQPVFYYRVESRSHYSAGGDCSGGQMDRDQVRSQYLAHLLTAPYVQPKANADLDAHSGITITFENAEQYSRELLTAIVGQREGYRRVAKQLFLDQQLSEEEFSAAQPHVEVQINDWRHDRGGLPTVLPNNEWTKVF